MSPFDEDPNDSRTEIDMCIEEIKVLQANLNKYGKHLPNCQSRPLNTEGSSLPGRPGACDCGLDKAKG